MTTRGRGELLVSSVVLGIATLAALAAIGVLLPTGVTVAAGVVLVSVLVAATSRVPLALPILVMPLVISVQRVGGAVNLSVSDFVLFAAFWVVYFLGPRPYPPVLRSLLWLSAIYQAATLLTIVVNPYVANVVEWFHAWLLVGGAILVGAALARAGHASVVLALIVAPCAFIAVLAVQAAILKAAHGQLAPVFLSWPYGMHKNYIGTTLVFAAVVVYARPAWLGWPKRLCTALFVLLTLGILASQARQAVVSLGVVVVVIALRRSAGAWRSRAVLLPVAAAVVVVAIALSNQLDDNDASNSANQRLSWYADSVAIWRVSPWFGVGLRWWYTQRFETRFQPPNAELEVVTSAGIVGLIAFGILMVGTLVVLWTRIPPEYGTLGFTAVLSRFVQGQLDLFWVAVSVSVPFLIAGVCVGAAARAVDRAQAAELEAEPEPLPRWRIPVPGGTR